MQAMNRRDFLTRSGLAFGALLVGDEALDAFARLTHVRKSFPSAGIANSYVTEREIDAYVRGLNFRFSAPPGVVTVYPRGLVFAPR